ncbi:glycosyltransferase family 4 protein [Echinicola sp. 20G]|uniref:glycosyltransferase family 4 protein n=1 Tax=Echinicola sp. 20G TaxID=2781961 RepID=UPI0019104749|nr:glycosyltransferase family 4 protein [Echinicola sp. 20G]
MNPIVKKNTYFDDLIEEENHDDLYSIEESRNVHFTNFGEKIKKVLFVSSGNQKNFDLAPFIKVQGDSLTEIGTEVTYFKIKGKGFFGYLKNIKNLRNFIKKNNFDLIHAHFTLSAWVAVLTFTRVPIVLSLMGTDALGRVKNSSKIPFVNKYLTFLTYLIQPFVRSIISKSSNIEEHVWMRKKSYILPNGVDIEKFDGKRTCYRNELGLSKTSKYILFLGNTNNYNKNFQLLKDAEDDLNHLGYEIIAPYPVNHDKIIKYLSSVDILVMCSLQEGSPNVVKESMASNCKGVFTDVGDVKSIIKGTKGYAITKFNKDNLVDKILSVDRTSEIEGRNRIISLGLDTKSIANRLKSIYSKSL